MGASLSSRRPLHQYQTGADERGPAPGRHRNIQHWLGARGAGLLRRSAVALGGPARSLRLR